MAERKKKFIKGMHMEKGALHRHLGIPEGEKIPREKIEEATHSKDPTIRKEANLALTLEGFHHHGKKSKPRRSAKEVRGALYGKEH